MVQNVFWCLHDTLCINIITQLWISISTIIDISWHQKMELPLVQPLLFASLKFEIYLPIGHGDIFESRPFHVFFPTFDRDKFGKIRWHHWKDRPKMRKIVKFESDSLRANEDTAPQSRKILQTFVWGLARVNFDMRHGPKSSDNAQNEIATRDNLPRPNCDSDSKAGNKRQAFINTDTGGFNIQTGDMGPPQAGPFVWWEAQTCSPPYKLL